MWRVDATFRQIHIHFFPNITLLLDMLAMHTYPHEYTIKTLLLMVKNHHLQSFFGVKSTSPIFCPGPAPVAADVILLTERMGHVKDRISR